MSHRVMHNPTSGVSMGEGYGRTLETTAPVLPDAPVSPSHQIASAVRSGYFSRIAYLH